MLDTPLVLAVQKNVLWNTSSLSATGLSA